MQAPGQGRSGRALPQFLQPGFAKAMSEAILLPAGALLVGLVAVLFLLKPAPAEARQVPEAEAVSA